MRQAIIDAYKENLKQLEGQWKSLNRLYNWVAYTRLGVFVLGTYLVYRLFVWDANTGLAGGLGMLTLFLLLVKYHNRLAARRSLLQNLQEIHREELAIHQGDAFQRDSGQEFADPDHPFTHDLDIFGKASLFQYLNRCVTQPGCQLLARQFQEPLREADAITRRQEAIRSLLSRQPWTHTFQAMGMGRMEDAAELRSIAEWLESPPFVAHLGRFKTWTLLLASLNLALWLFLLIQGGLGIPGTISWHLPSAAFILSLGIVGRFLPKTSAQHAQLSKKWTLLRKYARLLEELETPAFEAPLLKEVQGQVKAGTSASNAIARLGNIIYYLDQRLNPFAGILLNGLILWDLQCMHRLEQWRTANKGQVALWWKAIAEMDMLISLARFAYNHPDFCWPELTAHPGWMEAHQLGHPLLDPAQRVDNEIDLDRPGQFYIVTGANMAGKSTYLRAVGINLVMAQMGLPVCARHYRFTPVTLISSMRATDSLTDHESYFYAELKRLKRIIDLLKTQAPVFILVDEMLRGTNSRDKQTGSRKFIEQLIQLGGVGLIATHDLALGTLADDYPGQAINMRFEVEIENDQLHFDYKLKPGISQNLNATFLMEKMGIM